MLLAFIFDFLAEFNNAWSWAPDGQLFFPNKILGLIPVDVLIWYAFWITLTVLVYEHFFERDGTSERLSRYYKPLVFVFIGAAFLLMIVYSLMPALIEFKFAYLVIGLVGALPPVIYALRTNPRIIQKSLRTIPFLALVFFVFELTALHLDQWRFPGEYIGYVQLFHLTFPFEEFLFWILLSPVVVLSYYELFIDDRR